jgi:CubicO group peptidase (beta-lactamase class C family)
VVDGDNVLWAQGFGYTDNDGRTAITADTMFSVQSMSKLFTATGVMKAVQDGRLDLDAPITRYLPDFTVHSAFEEHPEQKITLRMLLSHTAGFSHEAPLGNNYDAEPAEYDAHVRTFSDSWLRFPVGTGVAYSNMGIDLAGYILQKVLGKPFPVVMDESVLAPLGMTHSTFDRARILAASDRAIGHTEITNYAHPLEPMMAAGGLYASANDLARFLSFEVGNGTSHNQTLLESRTIEEQRTVPAPNAGVPMGYALGVERTRWRANGNQDLYYHGGGGFGFLSNLWWAPKLGLGVALLTNSSTHNFQLDLVISLLRDFVDEPGSVFGQRLAGLPSQPGFVEIDTNYQAPSGMAALLAGLEMKPSTDQAERWARYEGTYRIASWGAIDPSAPPNRFLVTEGVPYFDSEDDKVVTRHRLTEVQPGLFLADNGETLDFRASQAIWRNLKLIPVTNGPLPWQWLLLALVAVVSVAWFAGGLLAAVRRRRASARRPRALADAAGRRGRRLMSAIAGLTASASLLTIGIIASTPGLADAGFIGWLGMPTVQRLALHLPAVVAFLALSMIVFGAVGLARRWWTLRSGMGYVALTVAAALLTIQLLAWHLVGWALA